MSTKLDAMIDELRDAYGVTRQSHITKLEDWEVRVSDINATIDEVFTANNNKVDTFASDIKRRLNETQNTMQAEMVRMGEQIRDLKKELQGAEKGETDVDTGT